MSRNLTEPNTFHRKLKGYALFTPLTFLLRILYTDYVSYHERQRMAQCVWYHVCWYKRPQYCIGDISAHVAPDSDANGSSCSTTSHNFVIHLRPRQCANMASLSICATACGGAPTLPSKPRDSVPHELKIEMRLCIAYKMSGDNRTGKC